MNEGLFSAYEALPEYKELLARVKNGSATSVVGMAEGERAFFAAALTRRTGRPVALLSPNELTAQRQAQDLNHLLGGGAAALPAREMKLGRSATSQETEWQRIQTLEAALSGKVRVLCLSAECLLDRCAPPERFRERTLRLAEGERFAPDALLKALLLSGYERVEMVEGKGQCAMRGAILDVFAPDSAEALRVEFFDDEIDSIRSFDCISQRSIARLKEARVAPATECLPEDCAKAAARLRAALVDETPTPIAETKATRSAEIAGLPSLEAFLREVDESEDDGAAQALAAEELLYGAEEPSEPTERRSTLEQYRAAADLIEAGQGMRASARWMNVLMEATVCAVAYLDDPILLCDEPDQIQNRARVRLTAFDEEWEAAKRRGDAFEKQRGLPFSYEEALSRLGSAHKLLLSDLQRGLGQMNPDAVVELRSASALPYQSQLQPLAKDIAQWKEKGFAIVLLTGGEARGRRLKAALSEQGAPSVYADTLDGNLISREVVLLPVSYTKGFINEKARFCLIGDADLFGTSYQRARKYHKAGERIASFTDLKTGDYVVHDTHGVGVYLGVVQLNNDGVTRDYLYIQYAGNDKLYVPTDQFDRVQKFIGAEHGAPKLNRLGGAEWARQKSKVKAGLKKLAFDLAELYAARQRQEGYAFSHETPWQREFEDAFPFELTADQQLCVEQIGHDMESRRNMDRLLCGDVGYGKTEVAMRAAFKAILDGKQVAILAPTTILVQQHYNTIRKRFDGFPITCEMISRFRTPPEQREILKRLKEGEIDLIVGTHRLLGKDVEFKDLGLLVVDEEHRFGVNHKEQIKHLKTRVDVLTLSATPIPRTLHMSMVGIRDISLLETPPDERLPVKTYVVPYDDAMIRDAIRRELGRGGQVYFLYNRVRSIERMYARLQALVPEARIGVAHGQMRENALEDVMLDFYAGAFDVLLCTTIIESGLDVPLANTLIVFDADRFGLSQLYQIRGRVGRSNRQAYAYFTVRQDKLLTETAEKRLQAIREFTEFGAGYRIAMRDLEIRGAGDVLGAEQHGHLSAVGYDMYVKLLEQAVGEAQGNPDAPELDTRVELRVDAFLPESYVTQEKLRVEVYKRIAMIDDENGRLAVEEELIDRFGDIPQSVENLIAIATLRAVTRRLGISHVTLRPDGIHLRLEEKAMPDAMLLITALRDTDARLAISVRQTPEMIIRQSGLSPEDALALALKLLPGVLSRLVKMQEKQAERRKPE